MSTPSAPSVVRTIVPVIVGQIGAYFATIGVTLPDDVMAGMTAILGFVFTAVWYLVVRFLEQRFPKLGILLGWAAVPAGYIGAKDREVVESEVVEPGDPKH